MAPEDAAELLIEDILAHWRIEGLSSQHLEIIRGNLYKASGEDIFVQWRALSTPTVERFKDLKLPADIKDLKQLEELTAQYTRKPN
jgi:hypothetical protein